MAELTEEELLDFIQSMLKLPDNFLDDLGITLNDIVYQGFDPKHLMKLLYKRGKAGGRSITDIIQDLKKIALIATVRGSSIQKISNKSTQETAQFLNRVKTTYQIIDGRPRTKNDATLPRIAAIFAASVSKNLYKNPEIRTRVEPTMIHQSFPKCMCMSNFGSLIPRQGIPEQDMKRLTLAFCYHQLIFDRMIKPNRAQHATKDVIRRYVQIQIKSNLHSDEQRITILLSVDILARANGVIGLSALVGDALKHAADQWEATA